MITDADKAECERVPEPLPFWLCAWCRKWYDRNGYLPEQKIPADEISHGCCQSCACAAIGNLKGKP